jgi:hypothetical protein
MTPLPPPLPEAEAPGFPSMAFITAKANAIITVMGNDTRLTFEQLASLFRIAAAICDEMGKFQNRMTGKGNK